MESAETEKTLLDSGILGHSLNILPIEDYIG